MAAEAIRDGDAQVHQQVRDLTCNVPGSRAARVSAHRPQLLQSAHLHPPVWAAPLQVLLP